MKSKAHRRFWKAFAQLPDEVRTAARAKFSIWRREPFHPSLQFKRIRDDLWSIRVTDDYRALGVRDAGIIIWYWIGSHAEYDRLIGRKSS